MSLNGRVGLSVLLFHAGGFALYACNLIYESNYILTPGSQTYGGRWKYLTHWNEAIQFMYFTCATLVDIVSLVSKSKNRNIAHCSRDFCFSVITFPLAMIVSVVFWIIYAIDRELIFPTFLDQIIPSLVNHTLHTFCFVLMILEALIVHHHYPMRRTALMTIFFMSSLYFSWMVWQAHTLSQWPYPFLQAFTITQHYIFYLFANGLLFLFYFLGELITTVRFNYEPKKLKKSI